MRTLKRIKYWVIFILIFNQSAQALPVLNENVASNNYMTVFPDHENKNVYYISPVRLEIAVGDNGVPLFSYFEYKRRFRSKNAIIQTIMSTGFMKDEIEAMMNVVKGDNANAEFRTLPTYESKVEFGDTLRVLVKKAFCDHAASTFEAEQACSFTLTSRGVKTFRKLIRDNVSLTMHYYYKIRGVLKSANGNYVDTERTHGVSGRIGGEKLKDYPELFRDSRGNIIDFN